MRLVKTAAANRVPSTRLSARACDDTSIAHAPQPASSISRSICCTSGASGVVRAASRTSPPMRYCTVPIRPQRMPAASTAACTRYDVVVLPFVPVMPTTRIRRLGWPKKCVGQQRERQPPVADGDPRHRAALRRVGLGDHGHRAFRDRLAGKGRAVGLHPSQRHEQRARATTARESYARPDHRSCPPRASASRRLPQQPALVEHGEERGEGH